MKRLASAVFIGCILAFTPGWLLNLPSDTGFVGSLKQAGSYVAVPGGFVGWIAAGGKLDSVNDINFIVVDIANLIIYSGLIYILLGVLGKRRDKTRQAGPTAG
jgi:hypothetical protein